MPPHDSSRVVPAIHRNQGVTVNRAKQLPDGGLMISGVDEKCAFADKAYAGRQNPATTPRLSVEQIRWKVGESWAGREGRSLVT
jgi:hypothetical protein